ncbi:uncharacterized protein SCHCODRAFT_02501042 [Schizophyllum commune H4-8]|nr:uncharacterized protein SCHCODRAFT_02501042 [Schizophyllum commune H4-8]KAI5893053.1 hypothetical protein SCHCODRAFT_02501042 [Schizophyllum commune H4-8]
MSCDKRHTESSKSTKSTTLVASVLKSNEVVHEYADGVNRMSATQAQMQGQIKILTDRVAALEAAILRITSQCDQAVANSRTVEGALSAQKMHTEHLNTAVSRLESNYTRLDSEIIRLRRAREVDEEEAEIERMHARATSMRARSAQEERLVNEIDYRLQETEDLILDEFEDLHGVLGKKLGYRRVAHSPTNGAQVAHARPRTPQQQPTPAATPTRAQGMAQTYSSGGGMRLRELIANEVAPHGDGSSTASNASSRRSSSNSSSSEQSLRQSRRPDSRDSPRRGRAPSVGPPTPTSARSYQENRHPEASTPKQVNFAFNDGNAQVRATAPAGTLAPPAEAYAVRPNTYQVGSRVSIDSGVQSYTSDESSMDERQRQARASLMSRISAASTYTAGPKTPREMDEGLLATRQADRARLRT